VSLRSWWDIVPEICHSKARSERSKDSMPSSRPLAFPSALVSKNFFARRVGCIQAEGGTGAEFSTGTDCGLAFHVSRNRLDICIGWLMRSMLGTIQTHLQNRLGVSSSCNGHRFRAWFGTNSYFATNRAREKSHFVNLLGGGSSLANESVQAPC
jgi:hypothetical protein